MPIESSTGYIPLNDSYVGFWRRRTSLEKRLLLLSVILAIIIFTLSLAFALKHCE
ncbi:hypothetical protein ILUMI_08554, partial [Ignelater luminosus]